MVAKRGLGIYCGDDRLKLASDAKADAPTSRTGRRFLREHRVA
jgi:hypothetical protein